MVAIPDSRGTCLHVSLASIAHNVRALRAHFPPHVRLMAVVKANAYGHGSIPVSRTALANGVTDLGVACPEEGVALRQSGITAPILVLGSLTQTGARLCMAHNLIQTVYRTEDVLCLKHLCDELDADAPVHLKLDTGMNRIGARTADEVNAVLQALRDAPRVHLCGAYTHFADATAPDASFSHQQLARFGALRRLLPADIICHAAASDASLRFPEAQLDMVREGISLYGCTDSAHPLGLRPAMRFVTQVAHIKELSAGETVGYGRAYRVTRPMRVATLPVGYGDGYPRACSNRAKVLLDGTLCPVLGNVCMDQMMVDITDAKNVRIGSPAVLMGAQGDRCITADMLADWAGTISYEILLSPHARVPVVYDDQGKDVSNHAE